LRTNGTATAFYGYRSASAHTGFEALGVANLMLHVDRNTQSLSLVFMAGIDGDLGGAVQPESALNARVSGLPPGARLLQSDDPGECDMRGDEVACDWDFRQNSDGLVVGPLPWDQDWAITLTPDFRDGVSTFRFQNGDARAVALLPRSAVTLEYRAQRPACRDDCTLPRCGDGRLDGGERCDDGNTRSGDGCRADCQRIE
jgi:cysteine-rich repeat protein